MYINGGLYTVDSSQRRPGCVRSTLIGVYLLHTVLSVGPCGTYRQGLIPLFKQSVFSSADLFLPRKNNQGNERGASIKILGLYGRIYDEIFIQRITIDCGPEILRLLFIDLAYRRPGTAEPFLLWAGPTLKNARFIFPNFSRPVDSVN
jgi:hypothetical protein